MAADTRPDTLHELAPDHLPGFIGQADGSDPHMTGVAIFLVVVILLIGVLYFTLHSLPEKMAHRTNHTQLQVVGILALIALFTHQNIFWVAAIVIAAVQFPDFSTPLNSIARSLERLTGSGPEGERLAAGASDVGRIEASPDGALERSSDPRSKTEG